MAGPWCQLSALLWHVEYLQETPGAALGLSQGRGSSHTSSPAGPKGG